MAQARKNKFFQMRKLPGDPLCSVTIDQAISAADQLTAETQYFIAAYQLQQLASAFPKLTEARLKLLELAVITGNGEMADTLITELEKLKVNQIDLLPLLVERAQKRGDVEAALKYVKKLTLLSPNSAKAYFVLGQVYRALGDKEQAVAAYDAVISRNPQHARPFYFRGLLLKQQLNDKQRKQLDNALALATAHNADAHSLAHLHLAKAWSHYGDVDEEFMYLDRAKQQLAANSGWNADLLWKNFSETASFSDAPRLRVAQAIDNSDHAPVFIIGMGRSGTTLLESVLSAHPSLMGSGERGIIPFAADQVGLSIGKNGAYWQWGDIFRLEELLARLHQRILQHESVKLAANKRWLDKSLNSFSHMGLIKMIYPRAKFIHIKRNPMAVCLSSYQHWMGAGKFVPLSLEQLAQNYQIVDRAVGHWKTLFPDDILSINFESLTNNFEKQLREILLFLGADWDPACLNFHEQKTLVLTPSTMQVRSPMNPDNENRWMRYEKHLQPVAKVLGL